MAKGMVPATARDRRFAVGALEMGARDAHHDGSDRDGRNPLGPLDGGGDGARGVLDVNHLAPTDAARRGVADTENAQSVSGQRLADDRADLVRAHVDAHDHGDAPSASSR
jgi:hypothetical protein